MTTSTYRIMLSQQSVIYTQMIFERISALLKKSIPEAQLFISGEIFQPHGQECVICSIIIESHYGVRLRVDKKVFLENKFDIDNLIRQIDILFIEENIRRHLCLKSRKEPQIHGISPTHIVIDEFKMWDIKGIQKRVFKESRKKFGQWSFSK